VIESRWTARTSPVPQGPRRLVSFLPPSLALLDEGDDVAHAQATTLGINDVISRTTDMVSPHHFLVVPSVGCLR
jgi:hypothetical protein